MLPQPSKHSKALGPGVTGPELLVPTPHTVEQPPSHKAHQPLSGGQPFCVDAAAAAGSRQHTQYPYVTGTSVIGTKFADGVIIACDTLGAYGSTKRYKSLDRIKKVNDRCVVAASGEISDFQHIMTLLDELVVDDLREDDGVELGPEEIYAYLCRVMYNRRNKFDPLWNSLVVGGVGRDGAPFLGTVGMIGTHYTDSHVTTGFANHLARPLLREKQSDGMPEAAAVDMMHDCLRVCAYRDKISINKFTLARVTKAGVSISEPFALDMKWDHKLFANPTKWAVGAW